jgi:hypothetical protein
MMLTKRIRRTAPVAALAVGGVLVAGCGGASSPNASRPKTVSFARAADVSSNAAGFKTNMTIDETISGQNVKADASGSFTPKSGQGSMTMNMTMPSSAGGQSVQLQMVMSQGTLYVHLPSTLASKLPSSKPWISMNLRQLSKMAHVPAFSMSGYSSSLYNPGQYLGFLHAASGNSVKNLGQQTVEGVQTTHYRADVSLSKVPDAVPPDERQAAQQFVAAIQKQSSVAAMPVDVWIDQSDLVRRLKLTINGTVQGHQMSMLITEDLSDYGPQPAPKVPSPGETTNLLSLIHKG